MSEKTPKDTPADTLERVQALVDRAVKGDRTVLPELSHVLDRHPEMWRDCGDLALQATEAWLKLTAGNDLLALESLRRKAKELNHEIAGEHPSPLERLLAERVAATWLQVNYADLAYSQGNRAGASSALVRSLIERQESAQRSHLAAVKQLALVRKLLKPAPSPSELLNAKTEAAAPRKSGGQRPDLRLARAEEETAG
jgi:hypothetical protein